MWSISSASLRSMTGRRDSGTKGSPHSVHHQASNSISSLKEARGLDEADAMSDDSHDDMMRIQRNSGYMMQSPAKPAIVKKMAHEVFQQEDYNTSPEGRRSQNFSPRVLPRQPTMEARPADFPSPPKHNVMPARTQASASHWATEAKAPKIVQKLANTILTEEDDAPKAPVVPEVLASQVVCKKTEGNKRDFEAGWKHEPALPKVIQKLANTVLPEEDFPVKKAAKPYSFTPSMPSSMRFFATENAAPKEIPMLASTYLPMDDTPPKQVVIATPAALSRGPAPTSLRGMAPKPKVIPMLANTRLMDDDDTDSQHTLADHEYVLPEKTPLGTPGSMTHEIHLSGDDMDHEDMHRSRGPLERQLAQLMSKVIAIERSNPTISVTPTEYHALQTTNADLTRRIAQLEAEKSALFKRYETIYAIRDEELTSMRSVRVQLAAERKAHAETKRLRQHDLSNLVTVRGLLARERKNHDGLKILREEDIQNVISIRGKLATQVRRADLLERNANRAASAAALERSPERSTSESSPAPMTRRPRPRSIIQSNAMNMEMASNMERQNSRASVVDHTMERRNTLASDLFTVAKTAAFEQRALELERANSELNETVNSLRAQLATSHSSSMHGQPPNSAMSLTRFGAGQMNMMHAGQGVMTGMLPQQWARVEAMHEEGLKYREKMGAAMQKLRGEKEALRRELDAREDEVGVLEGRVARAEMRLVGA